MVPGFLAPPLSPTYISLAVGKTTRVARREGGPKPDVALDIAGPSAGTKAAAREEYADAARLELREQVTHGPAWPRGTIFSC